MKVAILGGSGKMGGAIALGLSVKHQVIVGSRDLERAKLAARDIPGAEGATYAEACQECDAALFAIPYSAMDEAKPLADALAGKLVISIINPIGKDGGWFAYPLEKGSAAERLAELLPKSLVATAFNNIPGRVIGREGKQSVDILVAASSKEAYDRVKSLLAGVDGLRPLYAGPLSQARLVEEITVLELNLAKLNGTGTLSPRFVSDGDR